MQEQDVDLKEYGVELQRKFTLFLKEYSHPHEAIQDVAVLWASLLNTVPRDKRGDKLVLLHMKCIETVIGQILKNRGLNESDLKEFDENE